MAPIEFDGELLAEVSTGKPWKHRWTELSLYRTTGGRYVSVSVGQTTYAHEEVIRSARILESPDALVASYISRKRGSMSQPAIALLEAAALIDPAIDTALDAIEDISELVD